MTTQRLNAYRIMWVMCCFDLPVLTREERKAATDFRKFLLESGFMMLQFSIYARHCESPERAEVFIRRIHQNLPEKGSVMVFKITDKQFGQSLVFINARKSRPPGGSRQLEMF